MDALAAAVPEVRVVGQATPVVDQYRSFVVADRRHGWPSSCRRHCQCLLRLGTHVPCSHWSQVTHPHAHPARLQDICQAMVSRRSGNGARSRLPGRRTSRRCSTQGRPPWCVSCPCRHQARRRGGCAGPEDCRRTPAGTSQGMAGSGLGNHAGAVRAWLSKGQLTRLNPERQGATSRCLPIPGKAAAPGGQDAGGCCRVLRVPAYGQSKCPGVIWFGAPVQPMIRATWLGWSFSG